MGLGLPGVALVGLPDTVVRQSVDRVKAAVANAGGEFPNRRITIGLSPASMPKQGSGFDLALAVAVLAATGAVPAESVDDVVLLGELGLDGSAARRSAVSLPAVLAAARAGHRQVVVPVANADEAALVDRVEVLPVDTPGAARRAPGRPLPVDPAHPRSATRAAAGCPTSATWWARRLDAVPSRSPRPAVTTCSSPVRPVPARRCSPSGCPACCRRSTSRPRSRSRPSTRSPARCPSGAPLITRPTFETPHHSASMAVAHRRRGRPDPPRGAVSGPPRRAVPRRGARVPAGRPGRAAAAARAGLREHPPGRGLGHVPVPGAVGPGRQPVSVRDRCWRCRVHVQPAGAAALPGAAVRAAARPDRPPGRPAGRDPGGLARRRGRHRSRPLSSPGGCRRRERSPAHGWPAPGWRPTARCPDVCCGNASPSRGRRSGWPNGRWNGVRSRCVGSTACSASRGRSPIWPGVRCPAATRSPRHSACVCSGWRHEARRRDPRRGSGGRSRRRGTSTRACGGRGPG